MVRSSLLIKRLRKSAEGGGTRGILAIITCILLMFPLLTAGEDQTRSDDDPKQQEVERLFQEAVEFHNANDFDKAVASYTKVIELDPNHANSYLNRANIYLDQKKNDLAISDYQKVNRIAPDFDGAYGLLGLTLILHGKFEEAKVACQKAHELAPDSFAWAMALGHTYLLTGDEKKARDYYLKTLTLIKTDEEVTNVPVADFELFIEKGWQVEASKREMAWMVGEYEKLKLIREAETLNEKVVELFGAGNYEEAIPFAKKELEIREKALGKDHPDVATSLYNLAELYRVQGRYAEAEPRYKQSLKISEKLLGKDHADIAIPLNNLAELYRVQGRYTEAESLYKRSLEIYKKTQGEDHPDVALSMNNLALLYYTQGKYAEAEPLYKLSLEINEKSLGKDHPDVAKSLNNLAALYSDQGKYADAEPFYRRSLEISEKALGKDHPDVANSLNNLAGLYRVQGKYEDAEPLYKRSMVIYEKSLGKDHPNVAMSMNNLAALYSDQGRYADAEPYYKRSIVIYEKSLGKDHPDVAKSLNNLALLYYTQGRYADAEPYYKRSLEISEKALGKDHPDVANSLNNLAGLYYVQGKYKDAEPLYKRSMVIYEMALGKDHPDVAKPLNNLAVLYRDQGKYADAELLYKQSSEIIQKALGKDHPDVATALNNLAGLYHAQGKYADAEPLYRRSLEIYEKALGVDHPDIAIPLNNLAEFYRVQGRYADAEALFNRSLEIYKKTQGKDHPDVAKSLNNLALLYYTQGRYADAESLYKRSMAIYEKSLGKDHPNVANSLNNLAVLYRNQGKYADAEPFYRRSLEISEKALGKDHPDVANSLNNLAVLYHDQGKYADAEPFYRRSLEISEKALGKDHPDVANSLNNLAGLYRVQGKYEDAEPLYKRSMVIYEKSLGKNHPDVAKSLNSLALLKASMGKHLEGTGLFSRSTQIDNKTREEMFLIMTEKQKLAYVNYTRETIHAFIGHTAQYLPSDVPAITETFNAWLRWKGSVMEAQGRHLDACSSNDPLLQEKCKELNNTRRTLASLQKSKPEKLSFEEYRQRITKLERTKEALDSDLSKLSKDFALEKQMGQVTAASIAKILSRDSAYIDFAKISPYDFKKKEYRNSRYFVFMLLPGDSPDVKLIDLGEADKIDNQVTAYLQAMEKFGEYVGRVGEVDTPKLREITSRQIEASRAIYDLALKPIIASLKGVNHLFISTDGNLNLIPFEVLATPEGKSLIDDYLITYVGAGRDIIRFNDTSVARDTAVLMADPDYDMGTEETEKQKEALGLSASKLRGVSRDAGSLQFQRLPGTKTEADKIEKIVKDKYHLAVENYQDKKALWEVLKTSESPRFLHLSTHGYFLKDEEAKLLFIPTSGMEKEIAEDPGIENPMLRSGIALAGANTKGSDGLVSAEEILGLKLKGTELVVLSACETGVGDVQSGEGVFGLKRSFILSGAKTVVMSLWKIPSKETEELMGEFYTKMAEGKSKAEALREAQLTIKQKHPSPFYWGALVMVGNPK